MVCWRDLVNQDLSEKEIVEELLCLGILIKKEKCNECNCKELKRSREYRIKCCNCDNEWSVRKGSIAEKSKLSLRHVLIMYHMYEDGLTAHRTSQLLKINKNTSNKFFNMFRGLEKSRKDCTKEKRDREFTDQQNKSSTSSNVTK